MSKFQSDKGKSDNAKSDSAKSDNAKSNSAKAGVADAPAVPAHLQQAEQHYRLGALHYLDARYAEAIAEFNRAVELGLSDEFLYYSRGHAHHCLAQYEQAIADAERQVQCYPQSRLLTCALYNIACAYALLRRPKAALTYLRRERDAAGGHHHFNQAAEDEDFAWLLANDPDFATEFHALISSN